MSISIPKYQALYFKSLQSRTVNTGNNLVLNGNFDTDLANWTSDDYVWQSGTAAYQWSYGIFNGSVRQDYINLQPGNRYKLSFKYRSTKKFDIVVRLFSMSVSVFNAMPEQVFTAISDGNWHKIEFYCNSSINSTQYLLLGSRGFADEFGVNPLDGLQFDEVSIYAQKNVNECGSCDTIYVDKSKPIEFQIIGRKTIGNNLVPNGNFDINPFNKITSANFSFDVLSNPSSGNLFRLYIGNKIYNIQRTTDAIWAPFNEILTGNNSDIRVYSTNLSDFNSRLLSAIQATIDVRHGTATTLMGTTFTIAGIPTDSYLDDYLFNVLSNETTIITSTWNVSNIIYNDTTKQLNYQYFHLPNEGKAKTSVVLTAGKYYKFLYGYATVNSFNHTINIVNSSNVTVYTRSFNPLNYSYGVKNITFEFLATATDTYTIEFMFTPENTTDQLAFDNFSVYEIKLDDIVIQAKDCNGTVVTIPFTQKPYGENVLIQLNNTDFPAGSFQVIINDNETAAIGLQYYSQNIMPIDIHSSKECALLSRLLKISWTNDCRFGDIDYGNLPFVNEFYIYGYLKMAPIDKKERIQFNQPGGLPKTIYDHSVGKVEVQLGVYSETLMGNLARAFMHRYLQLNDEAYVNDDSSSLVTNSLDNGKYTARIELVKSGTELITTNCCF